jgi:hypothetical protein
LIRIIIGLLLIIHGFAHWNMTTVWGSKVSAQLRLLGESVALVTVLWALALIGFILSGIAVFIGLVLWRPLGVAAALISLLTMVLFWDLRMAIGAILDVGILVALLWLRWPTRELVGRSYAASGTV